MRKQRNVQAQGPMNSTRICRGVGIDPNAIDMAQVKAPAAQESRPLEVWENEGGKTALRVALTAVLSFETPTPNSCRATSRPE